MKFRLKEERRFEMSQKDKHVYPYIPNSVPETKAKMMEEIGIKDIEELYEDIPEHLRFKGELNLPEALPSEYALQDRNLVFALAVLYSHFYPISAL